jgi:PhnB protein
MPDITRNDRQRIIPMLAYDDAPAAMDFLRTAFGFEEKFRMAMPDGNIGHAEMMLHGNMVMLATTWKAGGLSSPKDLPAMPYQLFCEVDDVDAHYRQAVAAGAIVVAEPEDQFYGYRVYRAMDPEGHRWQFASPVAVAK